MAWLIRDGDVLAAVEPRRRAQPSAGAVILTAPVLPHTLNERAGLDVAWCTDLPLEGGSRCVQVKRTVSMRAWRAGRPLIRSGLVVVAERGAFERWRLKVGDQLEIKEV